MKNFFKYAWVIFCVILLLLFIVSCFSAYIPSSSFSYISLFAIAFPYLFILVAISSVISFYIKKRAGLIMLICLLPGVMNLSRTIAFNFTQQTWNKKNDSVLRIMTWNVQDFVNLSAHSAVRSKMLHLISQKTPDILCLQEFTNIEGGRKNVSVCKELDSLGYVYHFLSNDRVIITKNSAVIIKGVAVFSKIPFTDSGRINIRNDATVENLIYTDINFNGRPLRIYTAHLASFELYRDTDYAQKDIYEITYERKGAIQYRLREIEQVHQKEAEIIHREISKTNLPVVYCGDMNAVPSSYTYNVLKNNFQDAFLEKGSGIGATFYKILPMLRIDYCLADKDLEVTGCTVVNQKLSDHYPVITDMQWK